MEPSIRNYRAYLAAAIAAALLICAWQQAPALLDDLSFHGDTRQEIYWMARLQDPSLFPGDFLAHQSTLQRPPAMAWIYKAAVIFVDPCTFAKLLPFFLCPLFALFFFAILRTRNIEPDIAFLGTCFALLILWSKETTTFGVGDQEDFVPVILAMFLYGWIKNRGLWAAIALILSALLYPPAMLLCFFALGLGDLLLLLADFRKTVADRQFYYHIVAFALCLAYILFRLLGSAGSFGSMFGREELECLANFGQNGRTALFYHSFADQWANIRTGFSLDRATILSFVFAIVGFLVAPSSVAKTLGKRIGIFFFASLSTFALAHLLMMSLFAPSRYVRLPLPIIAALVTSAALALLAKKISNRNGRIALLLFFAGISMLLFGPLVKNDYQHAAPRALYEAIGKLDNHARIAAHPFDADDIPIASKKSAYISSEMSHTFFKTYYAILDSRLRPLFNAYYASNFEAVSSFCEDKGPTHFLVRKSRLRPDSFNEEGRYFDPCYHWFWESGPLLRFALSLYDPQCKDEPIPRHYYDPYNEQIQALFGDGKGPFGALNPPPENVIYDDGELLLYRCKDS